MPPSTARPAQHARRHVRGRSDAIGGCAAAGARVAVDDLQADHADQERHHRADEDDHAVDDRRGVRQQLDQAMITNTTSVMPRMICSITTVPAMVGIRT